MPSNIVQPQHQQNGTKQKKRRKVNKTAVGAGSGAIIGAILTGPFFLLGAAAGEL